jgi:hypothetical protein
MNERIKELAQAAGMYVDLNGNPWPKWMSAEECEVAYKKFAELIIAECTMMLFDESERLSELYSEEVNMRLSEEYEICSNQCVNDIALIEKHFGVEE